MTDVRVGTFRQLELIEDVLRRAGNDLVVVEPQEVQYGDYETLQRYTVEDAAVVEWRADRGSGAPTGTWFGSAADAESWIVAEASGSLREASGLRPAHWLLDRDEELPEGFTMRPDGTGVILEWANGGAAHRARFGGALPTAFAVQFSTVACVPIDQIEVCALEPDSRAAFAAASVACE